MDNTFDMSLLGAPVPSATSLEAFAAGGRIYNLEQVIGAADFRGVLKPFWQRWREGIARASLAAEHGWEANEAALEELARDYRYERGLTTAEECERWLAARGVDPEDFEQHFVRHYWERRLKEQAVAKVAIEAEELSRLFRIDLVLSDEFDGLARHLAWRVALGCEEKAALDGAGRSLAGTPDPNPGALVVPIDQEWLAELQRLEAAFHARSERLVTLPNRQRWLATLRLSLIRVELEVLGVDIETAAHEAFLCVEQDGMSLGDVAAQSGFALREVAVLVEDLPPEWQQRILSASPHSVLPPFATGTDFEVCFLKSKQQPSLDDPAVRARVDTAILRQHFMDLETRHVRWQISPEASS